MLDIVTVIWPQNQNKLLINKIKTYYYLKIMQKSTISWLGFSK